MNWTYEAVKEVEKLPFFLRNLARRKLEKNLRDLGLDQVEAESVKLLYKDQEILKYIEFYDNINSMDYRQNLDIKICGGLRGCSLALVHTEELVGLVYRMLETSRILAVLEENKGRGARHKKLRLALAACPNSCSQPQIADLGLVGFRRPSLKMESCIGCGLCQRACPLDIIDLEAGLIGEGCLGCQACLRACKNKALEEGKPGYRILLGGRLGKEPSLAYEYKEVYSLGDLEQELDYILKRFIGAYKNKERISDIEI